MHKRLHFKLWYTPIVGMLIGFIAAAVFIESFTATWRYLGSPPDKIDSIIGISEGNRLYVTTTSGDIYSLEYWKYLGQDRSSFLNSFSHRVSPDAWTKEIVQNIEPYPINTPYWDFFVWPVLFEVKQYYEFPYPLVEGSGLIRFALSESGNLWGWNFAQGGMARILYYFCPGVGLILGIVIVIGTLIRRLFRKEQP